MNDQSENRAAALREYAGTKGEVHRVGGDGQLAGAEAWWSSIQCNLTPGLISTQPAQREENLSVDGGGWLDKVQVARADTDFASHRTQKETCEVL